ncbi:uncharacterized protein LOC113932183 isoform X2 [Zalophus californianus]|uniref:Uncharacterized protein LOC113932183 isoform X2 n=1 Tax=Zalophus californianus TaxID=9704 RepID=A0A6J2ECM6_ZALCA|nr:uncharacterized protein LOC113932183 isoform X2 [Zalophus californianus]
MAPGNCGSRPGPASGSAAPTRALGPERACARACGRPGQVPCGLGQRPAASGAPANYEPRESSSSQGYRRPSRFQAADVVLPASRKSPSPERLSEALRGPGKAVLSSRCRLNRFGPCSPPLAVFTAETKEAWRAPGAEDPSFNTFAVPLTSIHSFADDLGYQGSQELTSS